MIHYKLKKMSINYVVIVNRILKEFIENSLKREFKIPNLI